MPFVPLQRESAVDACARAMRDAIMSGQLGPGDRLPPERKLAEDFGVNRVTVRGALARLAHAQLLSVRQGSGYRVRDYRDAGGPDLIPGLLDIAKDATQRRAVVADLLRMRRALAGAVIERLLELETISVDPIDAAITEMEAVANSSTDLTLLAAADLAVLSAIVDATNSAVIRLCLNPIAQVLVAMPSLCAAMYQQPSTNVAGYRAMAAWCRNPEPHGIAQIKQLLLERDRNTLAIVDGQASS